MSDFKAILNDTLSEFELSISDTAAEKLCRYYDLLIEWNKVMNLTALTEPRDVALKHFADSLALLKYCDIDNGASVIDVGTGAGFPGVVLAIARPDLRITLLDSLQKRLSFLDEVCKELDLPGVKTVHSRAEDGARTDLRDSFDYAVARAVAPLNVLCEYCLPYVKAGGRFLAMKGRGAAAELSEATAALNALNSELNCRHNFELGEAGERSIMEIVKLSPTPAQYPRKSKIIKCKPL